MDWCGWMMDGCGAGRALVKCSASGVACLHAFSYKIILYKLS